MPKWTQEQSEAIDKDGTNIIVSAGAGSGKTAVLTARVIRKLMNGININQLLVLTFTKAAAQEMKERIRKAITKNNAISNQLNYIDSSYITTFDSYALSIVKRYHYLLNITNNVSIIDASIIYYEKKKIIDSIFNELYESKNSKFLKLIGDLTIKDDEDIKKMIIYVGEKLDLKYDKDEYLDKYIDNYYNDSYISKMIEEYEQQIFNEVGKIREVSERLEEVVDAEYYDKLLESINSLMNATSYDDVVLSLEIKLPMLKKGSDEETKNIKQELSNRISSLKKKIVFDSIKDIKEAILLTKDYVDIIIYIIISIDRRINQFKKDNSSFEFNDISKMAIRILKENTDVRDELKYSFNEIMIDEYQDTNDLQETFVSMIENNNVYMVGDIKQSIYRFRNANPYIFKEKYDKYSKEMDGYKIDLNKNFRSRMEVLSDINKVFDLLMTDDYGGASYSVSHRMVFGNQLYNEEGKTKENQNMDIYCYEYDSSIGHSKEEIEAFFIANDIKTKIENNFKVFDKELNILRNITYSDFVILMDRSTSFNLYKKVFEYLMIPITKYTKTSITEETDTYLLKNIIGLIIKTKNKVFDNEFKYYFTSVARSYLFRYSDQEIFDILSNNSFKENSLMTVINSIVNDIDFLTNKEIVIRIIDDFNIYSKHVLVGDMMNSVTRFEAIENILEGLSSIGNTIYDAFLYLDTMIKDEYRLESISIDNSSDSVKIMTIHASKGLEFPVCYFPGLYSKFNIRELNEKILYNDKYGIIAPYFKEGIGSTIYKYLAKSNYIAEEISEKIRLFYVALTRAREKIIIIVPKEKEINIPEVVDARSFLDFLALINNNISESYISIDIDSLNITDKYNQIREYNYKDSIDGKNENITYRNIEFDNYEIKETKFSKSTKTLYSDDEKRIMDIGTKVHYYLEMIDFKNPDFTVLDIDISDRINRFLSSGIDFKNANIYKEYEFTYNDEKGNNCHGIIDLILEYDDCIKIIDYKLSNIDDMAYIEQLKGYKKYISTKTNKKLELYLYSIFKEEFRNIVD